MDSRFIPVAMLAGALALAGCGGGSSTTASGTGNENGAGGEEGDRMPARSGTLSALALPADASFEVTTATAREGAIPAGKYRDFGNVRVTCDGAVACNYEIREGKIFANNGAKAGPVPTPEPETVENTATATNHEETGLGWLSDGALVNAVKNNTTIRLTRNNVPLDMAARTGTEEASALGADEEESTVRAIDVDVAGGRETRVRLIETRGRAVTGTAPNFHDRARNEDYLVYGTWETTGITALGNEGTGKLWAGSIPYRTVATYRTGSAEYNGHALGHYKSDDIKDTDPWYEWHGDVTLRADFAQGLVEGEIDGLTDSRSTASGAFGTTGANVASITLEETRIGATARGDSGVVTGGTLPDGVVRGNIVTDGRWEAEFYGSVADGEPSGVAGGFEANRDAIGTLPGFVIEGAFGAHNNANLPEVNEGG